MGVGRHSSRGLSLTTTPGGFSTLQPLTLPGARVRVGVTWAVEQGGARKALGTGPDVYVSDVPGVTSHFLTVLGASPDVSLHHGGEM